MSRRAPPSLEAMCACSSDASGWQRWSGRPSRRSRYTQRQRLVGVRGRCPESTQHDSEVHGRGVRGTEGRSLGRKHRERSLPLAIPEPARVADGRLGRSVPMAKGEAHQAGNLQAACIWRRAVGRAITTCNRGRVRRWRVKEARVVPASPAPRSKPGSPARSRGGAGCHRCPGAPSGGGGPPRPPPVPLPPAARRQRRRPPLHQRRREAVVGTPAGDARIGCHRTGRRAPSGAVIVHGEPSTAASLLGALESRGSCWRRGWDRQRRQQLSRI